MNCFVQQPPSAYRTSAQLRAFADRLANELVFIAQVANKIATVGYILLAQFPSQFEGRPTMPKSRDANGYTCLDTGVPGCVGSTRVVVHSKRPRGMAFNQPIEDLLSVCDSVFTSADVDEYTLGRASTPTSPAPTVQSHVAVACPASALGGRLQGESLSQLYEHAAEIQVGADRHGIAVSILVFDSGFSESFYVRSTARVAPSGEHKVFSLIDGMMRPGGYAQEELGGRSAAESLAVSDVARARKTLEQVNTLGSLMNKAYVERGRGGVASDGGRPKKKAKATPALSRPPAVATKKTASLDAALFPQAQPGCEKKSINKDKKAKKTKPSQPTASDAAKTTTPPEPTATTTYKPTPATPPSAASMKRKAVASAADAADTKEDDVIRLFLANS